jgi:hypothetical protein
MEELTLSDGVILRLEPTPSLAVSEVIDLYPELATPPLPEVEHVTKFGKEKLPAKKGEEQFAEWLKLVDEVKAKREKAQSDFMWDVGVLEWSHDDGKTWEDEAPEGWEMPKRLARHGFAPSLFGTRVDYIKYHLLRYGRDTNVASRIVYGATSPLTAEEVAAAREMFPGDEVEEESS